MAVGIAGCAEPSVGGAGAASATRDFELPEECVRAVKEFMVQANPLLAFVEDETVADPNGHTLLRDFREAMTQWASGQGMKKPVPYKKLKRQLEGLGYEVKMVEGYNRVYGLTLKP